MGGLALRRQFARSHVVLRGNAEGICNAVEEGEQRGNVYRLGNLVFFPPRRSHFVHVFGGSSVRRFGNQFHIIQQRALCRGESRLLELALENSRYALIGGSLNPQEVSVAVQSIRAAVQV